MATITSIALSPLLVRSVDVGNYNIDGKPTLPAAASGDRIVLFTMPHGARALSAHLTVPATLGAATLKMQRNRGGVYFDISGTTTAGTAGTVNSSSVGPFDLLPGDSIELLVGAGSLTSGVVEYDVSMRHV